MGFTLKKALVSGMLVALAIIIVFFAYYQSRAIIAGPQIVLTEPQNGITVTLPLVTIRGVATHAKELTLQGRSIFIDLEGNFTEELLLADGYNRIELTAKDVQGREIKKVLELVYKAPPPNTLTQ